ncbi:hypothetical protein ACXKTX_26600 [Burkholderia gladioli]
MQPSRLCSGGGAVARRCRFGRRGRRVQAGGASIDYRRRTSPDKQRVLHDVSIDGGPAPFSEDNLPD